MVNSFITDLLRIQIQKTIVGPLSQGLNSLLGNLFSGSVSPALSGSSPQTSILESGQMGALMSGSSPATSWSTKISTRMAQYSERARNLSEQSLRGSNERMTQYSSLRSSGQNTESFNPTVEQTVHIDARGADSSVIPNIERALQKNKEETVKAILSLSDRGGIIAKKLGRRR
jgi:hypothetical protein